MKYEFTAILDEEVPQAVNRLFQHLVSTYAGEANKTASMFLPFTDHQVT